MFATGQPVGQVPVYGGARSTISVRANGAVSILTPNEGQGDLTARIVYQGPIVAPVEEGTPIGVLRVTAGGQVTMEMPVFAAEAVGLGSLHQRAFDALAELAVGWLRNL